MSSHATVLPFEGDADRKVQVANGILNDAIAPNAVNLYRIGCTVAAPPAENLSPNPSFETPSLLVELPGWSGGRAGRANSDGHDTRARMFLDTTRPQHGRYAPSNHNTIEGSTGTTLVRFCAQLQFVARGCLMLLMLWVL